MIAALALCSCQAKTQKSSRSQQATVRRVTSVRHAKPFEKISMQGVCDVKFVQGKTFSVKVVGPENLVKDVETIFTGSTLVVKNKNRLSKHNKHLPKVCVTSPDLTGVRLDGVGDFEIDGLLDTDVITIDGNGVGDIDLKRVVCDEFRVRLTGTGDVEVGSLTAKHSDIRVDGVGNVEIDFKNSGSAECRLNGIGNIELGGTLKTLQKHVSGMGKLDTKDLRLGR